MHYAYDGFGRRIQVTDNRNADDRIGGNNKISWEHDALGRVSRVVDQDGWQVLYSWRADGQRNEVRVIEPDDLATMYYAAYLYDKAGRLEYVAEPLRGITTPWVAKLAYDDNGNRSGLSYYLDGTFGGDTVAVGYGYNDDNRLTGFSTTGGPSFTLASTTVDGLGRLRAGTETLTLVGGGTRQHVLSYGYDMRSQLKTASVSNINSTTWTASYTYDKAGNVTQQTIGGNETDFDYDGDLMTAKGVNALDWDADGRMISGLSRSLAYNWDSKLRSATSGGTTVALRYDPDGNRVLRTVNSTASRKYIVDTAAELPTILMEIDPAVQDPNQAITKTYLYANSQIIAQHDGYFGDAMYFYLHDRLGSVREVIDTSAAVVNTYTYEPFGQSFPSEVTQTVANPWQFTGQYFDSEFGQYFLRARQYDLAMYRFTSRDPYEGSFEEPLELHRYLYCLNEGINKLDPSGREGSITETEVTVSEGATVESGLGGVNYNLLLNNCRNVRDIFSFRNKYLELSTKSLENLQRFGNSVNDIHHLVGRGWGNLKTFGSNLINSAGNLIKLPRGVHRIITRYLNSGGYSFMNGAPGSLQHYLSRLSYGDQLEWGCALLNYVIENGSLAGFNPAVIGLVIP
ncbi:MAG: RHS repeat-associated core domain-containing protein [Phycisphaerae bacterium]|nr:RHS repeat-associated core domain-containing protein [Phycisphaerae bacterium]